MPRGARAGLAALFLVVAPGVAWGQDEAADGDPAARQQIVDQERRRLVQQYDESVALEADVLASYELSTARAADLAAELATIDTDLTATSLRLGRAERALDDARRAARLLAARAADARVALADRRNELRDSTIASYVASGDLTGLAGWGGLASSQDLALSMFYARHVNDLRRARVDAVREQERLVEARSQSAGAASLRAEGVRDDVAEARETLQSLRGQRAEAKAEADLEVVRQDALVQAVRARRGEYEERIGELEAESAWLDELLRAQQVTVAVEAAADAAAPSGGGQAQVPAPVPAPDGRVVAVAVAPKRAPAAAPALAPAAAPKPTAAPAPQPVAKPAPATTNNAGAGPPPAAGVSLRHPLPGYPIVSKYGWRVHPILAVRKLHEGIDIWAPAGTPIQAAGSGVVVWVGPRNGFGNAVVIDHGSGVATLYAHLSGFNVSKGRSIGAGATIGYVGQTGLASGPHLHLEVRVNGRSYDPQAYLRGG